MDSVWHETMQQGPPKLCDWTNLASGVDSRSENTPRRMMQSKASMAVLSKMMDPAKRSNFKLCTSR
eukprot:2121994-Amphidinium_carterae.2